MKIVELFHAWIVRRRKAREQELAKISRQFRIFEGVDFYYSSPWYIKMQIARAIQDAAPFTFNDSMENSNEHD